MTIPDKTKLTTNRSYPDRGSIPDADALKAIFKASPIAHVAFLHSGKGLAGPDQDERARILNLPLLVSPLDYEAGEDDDGDSPDPGELVLYFHTYAGSRIVQAIKEGVDDFTVTSSIIDGVIFAPTSNNHSVNYRSACVYAYHPKLLTNTVSGLRQKKRVLDLVTNNLSGYDRMSVVGEHNENELKRTTVIRLRIEAVSMKQRTGGLKSESSDSDAWSGVIPCWVQYGEPQGKGKGQDEVESCIKSKSDVNRAYAHLSAEGKI